jgi:hypothetical protein
MNEERFDCVLALCLQHGQTAPLARVRTPSSPVRDREKERGGGRERERKRERERMMGALAPFSYLVIARFADFHQDC